MPDVLFLGRGETFPFQPTPTGEVALIEARELVQQSILDILITEQGSIFAAEEYGSVLHELTFMQNDIVLKSLLVTHIERALNQWEKRIRVTDITCETVGISQIDVLVTYVILPANSIDSFVFPFYRELKS